MNKNFWIKVSIAAVAIILVVLISKIPRGEQEIGTIKEPHNLAEGQCVIQVLGEKDKLFEQMKERCRILVVLDKDGTISEIIEK